MCAAHKYDYDMLNRIYIFVYICICIYVYIRIQKYAKYQLRTNPDVSFFTIILSKLGWRVVRHTKTCSVRLSWLRGRIFENMLYYCIIWFCGCIVLLYWLVIIYFHHHTKWKHSNIILLYILSFLSTSSYWVCNLCQSTLLLASAPAVAREFEACMPRPPRCQELVPWAQLAVD